MKQVKILGNTVQFMNPRLQWTCSGGRLALIFWMMFPAAGSHGNDALCHDFSPLRGS